ncbi:DsbA family protein [uncultured Aliiroseovarius sp.]|uniref:DsbA family protein n=1 Tax=uncultured Aliiroseovarius sp. TaxID=1658783 RepID=UPI002592E915|nr:DsbA family protein [uncultured Aliiroseovarius sp.]
MTKIARRNLLIAGVAGLGTAAIIGTALIPVFRKASAEDLAMDDILFDPDNPVLGNPEGDVTIVEFFDYQCPYCKRDHSDLMDVVVNDGNTRLVMKDWPIFGAPSIRASQLVFGAAGLGAYEAANKALMATSGRLTDAEIETTLERAGFKIAELEAEYQANRGTWDGLMSRNSAQAAQLGLRGTPAFIIGDAIYPGAMNRAALKRAIATSRK